MMKRTLKNNGPSLDGLTRYYLNACAGVISEKMGYVERTDLEKIGQEVESQNACKSPSIS